MSARRLRGLVDRAVEARLIARGFKKVKDGVFMLDLAPQVRGWVGIGLASTKRAGKVDADPMVGVRYEPVERVIPSSRAHEATVFRPLYELFSGGAYRTWSFDQDNLEEQADALVEALEQCARPFMSSLATGDAIEEALTTWAFADIRRKRLPAFRLAQGDEAGAREDMEREKSLLAKYADPATLQEYDSFVSELLRVRPT